MNYYMNMENISLIRGSSVFVTMFYSIDSFHGNVVRYTVLKNILELWLERYLFFLEIFHYVILDILVLNLGVGILQDTCTKGNDAWTCVRKGLNFRKVSKWSSKAEYLLIFLLFKCLREKWGCSFQWWSYIHFQAEDRLYIMKNT